MMGESSLTPDEIGSRLYESASALTRSALDAYSRAEWPIYYLHGGAALEHLAKAVLASVHPALIAAPNDFDSLLALSRTDPLPAEVVRRLRTRSLDDALKGAGKVAPGLLPHLPNVRKFIEHRHSSAHLGLIGDHFRGDLVPVLRCMVIALDELGSSAGDFFGDFQEFVAARLQESTRAGRLDALARIAAARLEFSRRFGAETPEPNLLHSLYGEDWHEVEIWDQACPACTSPVLVQGELQIDYEVDFDHREGTPVGATAFGVFFPESLTCRVCQLRLVTPELIEGADLSGPWDAPNELVELHLEFDRYADSYMGYEGYMEPDDYGLGDPES